MGEAGRGGETAAASHTPHTLTPPPRAHTHHTCAYTSHMHTYLTCSHIYVPRIHIPTPRIAHSHTCSHAHSHTRPLSTHLMLSQAQTLPHKEPHPRLRSAPAIPTPFPARPVLAAARSSQRNNSFHSKPAEFSEDQQCAGTTPDTHQLVPGGIYRLTHL